jgi:hypothetical protein
MQDRNIRSFIRAAGRIYNYTVPVGTISTLNAMYACQLQTPARTSCLVWGIPWLFNLAMPLSLILPETSHARAFPGKANPKRHAVSHCFEALWPR